MPKAEKGEDYEEYDGRKLCLICMPEYEKRNEPCMHGMFTKYFQLPDSQEEYTQEVTPWQEELTLSQWACEAETQDIEDDLMTYKGEEIFEPEDMQWLGPAPKEEEEEPPKLVEK